MHGVGEGAPSVLLIDRVLSRLSSPSRALFNSLLFAYLPLYFYRHVSRNLHRRLSYGALTGFHRRHERGD